MQDLIVKHLSGNTTKEEVKVLTEWLNADVTHQAEYDLQKKLWSIFGEYEDSTPEVDIEKAWGSFNEKMKVETSKNNKFFILKLASVFIVLLISVSFVLNFKSEKQIKSLSKRTELNKEKNNKTLQVSLTNEALVLKPIHKSSKNYNSNTLTSDTTFLDEYELVDSSTAYLSSNSVLTGLDQTPHQNRLVSLTGAGLFNIKPSNKDFQLETDDLIIKVQGTKFNVQKSAVFDNVIEISVEEGVMDVQEKINPSNMITVLKNQTYHFDKVQHQFKLISSTEEKSKKSVFYKLFKKSK